MLWSPAFSFNGNASKELKSVETELNIVVVRDKLKRQLRFHGSPEIECSEDGTKLVFALIQNHWQAGHFELWITSECKLPHAVFYVIADPCRRFLWVEERAREKGVGRMPVAVGTSKENLRAVEFYKALNPGYTAYGSQKGKSTVTYGWSYDPCRKMGFTRFLPLAKVDSKMPESWRQYSSPSGKLHEGHK